MQLGAQADTGPGAVQAQSPCCSIAHGSVWIAQALVHDGDDRMRTSVALGRDGHHRCHGGSAAPGVRIPPRHASKLLELRVAAAEARKAHDVVAAHMRCWMLKWIAGLHPLAPWSAPVRRGGLAATADSDTLLMPPPLRAKESSCSLHAKIVLARWMSRSTPKGRP